MSDLHPYKLKSLEEYDKLPDSVKEKFREFNLEFEPMVWFQCTMLSSSNEESIKLFKKVHDSL